MLAVVLDVNESREQTTDYAGLEQYTDPLFKQLLQPLQRRQSFLGSHEAVDTVDVGTATHQLLQQHLAYEARSARHKHVLTGVELGHIHHG